MTVQEYQCFNNWVFFKPWRGCWKSTCYFLCKWLRVIMTKDDGRKENKERGFERLPSFFFPPFLLVFLWFFILGNVFWFKFGRFFLYFEDSNGFKFLKLWIIILKIFKIPWVRSSTTRLQITGFKKFVLVDWTRRNHGNTVWNLCN